MNLFSDWKWYWRKSGAAYVKAYYDGYWDCEIHNRIPKKFNDQIRCSSAAYDLGFEDGVAASELNLALKLERKKLLERLRNKSGSSMLTVVEK